MNEYSFRDICENKKKEFRQYLWGIREIFSIIWKADNKLAILLVSTSLIRNIYNPIQSFGIRGILNAVTAANDSSYTMAIQNQVLFWLVIYFIPFAANRIWWPLNAYTQSLMLAQISNEVKDRIMSVIQSASLEFFDRTENYDVLKNASEQTDGRRPIGIVNNIVNSISTVASLVIVLIPMLAISPVITLILAASSVPGIIIDHKFGKRCWQFEKDTALQKRKMDYAFNLFTSKKSAKEIHQFNLSGYIADKHEFEFSSYHKTFLKLHNYKFKLDLPAWTITQVAALLGYFIFMKMTVNEQITIGDLSFFIAVISQIQGAVNTIGSAYNNTINSSRFINNLVRLGENRYIDPVGGNKIENNGCISLEFRNVTFSYPGSNTPTLKNISFSITLPEHLAIVGLNGSGKTTLIKLLLRYYDPQEGEILFNGINIKELDINEWRSIFNVCFQDIVNYGFSIKDSISLSNLGANNEEINEAMVKAGLAELADNLPKGTDTCLSKEFDRDAVELSGGQYSRIALARAFLGNGRIVVLDEPTAALDAKAESKLFGMFDELEKDKLGIMITHRLSSTVNADRILVLENGCLAESGSHADLMNIKGIYYSLFEMQAKAYREEATA